MTQQPRPIDENTPRDRRILLFRLGSWRIGMWIKNRPRPYWLDEGGTASTCRNNPPTHWVDIPEDPF